MCISVAVASIIGSVASTVLGSVIGPKQKTPEVRQETPKADASQAAAEASAAANKSRLEKQRAARGVTLLDEAGTANTSAAYAQPTKSALGG